MVQTTCRKAGAMRDAAASEMKAPADRVASHGSTSGVRLHVAPRGRRDESRTACACRDVVSARPSAQPAFAPIMVQNSGWRHGKDCRRGDRQRPVWVDRPELRIKVGHRPASRRSLDDNIPLAPGPRGAQRDLIDRLEIGGGQDRHGNTHKECQ